MTGGTPNLSEDQPVVGKTNRHYSDDDDDATDEDIDRRSCRFGSEGPSSTSAFFFACVVAALSPRLGFWNRTRPYN